MFTDNRPSIPPLFHRQFRACAILKTQVGECITNCTVLFLTITISKYYTQNRSVIPAVTYIISSIQEVFSGKKTMRKSTKGRSGSGGGSYQTGFGGSTGSYQTGFGGGNTTSYTPSFTDQGQPVKPSRVNKKVLFITMAAGLALQLLCGLIYNAAINSIPRPLLIGLLFLIFSLVLTVIVRLLSPSARLSKNQGRVWAIIAMLTAALFLVSVLFQFLYGLGINGRTGDPTSYIFMIDCSGSMEYSDPEQKRYDAIDTIMGQMDGDFPYMVYSFSDYANISRDMAPKSEGHGVLFEEAEGGTSIKGVLEQAITDYSNKQWDGGDNPRVILLTDGYATDLSFFNRINKVLKEYNRYGISVSTVGLGDVDETLMRQIAEGTGGVFISVDDVSDLADAMGQAAVRKTNRDLLSPRTGVKRDALYAIMRIVFLTIMGALVGGIAAIAYEDDDSTRLSAVAAIITAVLGALVMELGTGLFAMDSYMMWRIMWILFAMTIGLVHDSFRANRTIHDTRGFNTGGGPAPGPGNSPFGNYGGSTSNSGFRRK